MIVDDDCECVVWVIGIVMRVGFGWVFGCEGFCFFNKF